MTLGILDEYDKSIVVPSSLNIQTAIDILDRLENYIPAFFSKNSHGNRIIELYNFEKDNSSTLVNIQICDCEYAMRQYDDYIKGMYDLVMDDEMTSFDVGTVYDRDVLFVNNCFDDSNHRYSANVGQALNQFECLINARPDLKKAKQMLSDIRTKNVISPYIGVFCHSICTFYKRLIKEILTTYVSLDDAASNPRKYYTKPVTETVKSRPVTRRAR